MLLSVCVAVRYYSRLFEESLTFLAELLKDEEGSAEIIILFNATDERLLALAERTSERFPQISLVSYEGTRSRRDLMWSLAQEAKGKFLWFLGDGVLPMKGSASLILSIINDDKLSIGMKVLLLNTGKFAEDYQREMQNMEELVVFKTIKESNQFARGLDFMKYFALEDLLAPHAMVFDKAAFLRTSFASFPETMEHPHLVALLECANQGAAVYFPRICTIARDEGLQKDTARRMLHNHCELPMLYKRAAELGVARGNSTTRLNRILGRSYRECAIMLLHREQFQPIIEEVWKHHSKKIVFWFTIFPMDVLLTPAFMRRFAKRILRKTSPDMILDSA